MKYRHRQCTVEAVHFDGNNRDEVTAFAIASFALLENGVLTMGNGKTTWRVKSGDWVVRSGFSNETVFVCDGPAFRAQFERVQE